MDSIKIIVRSRPVMASNFILSKVQLSLVNNFKKIDSFHDFLDNSNSHKISGFSSLESSFTIYKNNELIFDSCFNKIMSGTNFKQIFFPQKKEVFLMKSLNYGIEDIVFENTFTTEDFLISNFNFECFLISPLDSIVSNIAYLDNKLINSVVIPNCDILENFTFSFTDYTFHDLFVFVNKSKINHELLKFIDIEVSSNILCFDTLISDFQFFYMKNNISDKIFKYSSSFGNTLDSIIYNFISFVFKDLDILKGLTLNFNTDFDIKNIFIEFSYLNKSMSLKEFIQDPSFLKDYPVQDNPEKFFPVRFYFLLEKKFVLNEYKFLAKINELSRYLQNVNVFFSTEENVLSQRFIAGREYIGGVKSSEDKVDSIYNKEIFLYNLIDHKNKHNIQE